MALFQKGDKFSVTVANLLKTLNAGVTAPSNPGLYEPWLDLSTTPANLRFWDGSEWKYAGGNASELLEKIKTVDGSGSGLDADKLDGQEGSYYRNASNLNAGTVPQARLAASDLLTLIKTVDGSGSNLDADMLDSFHHYSFLKGKENDTGNSSLIYAQTGSVNGSTGTVTFSTAFTEIPIITHGMAENKFDSHIATYNITTTGFTYRVEGHDGVPKTRLFHWTAIGKK